jgi:hypothetical protein
VIRSACPPICRITPQSWKMRGGSRAAGGVAATSLPRAVFPKSLISARGRPPRHRDFMKNAPIQRITCLGRSPRPFDLAVELAFRDPKVSHDGVVSDDLDRHVGPFERLEGALSRHHPVDEFGLVLEPSIRKRCIQGKVKLAARRKDCAPLLQSSLVTRCWREKDSKPRSQSM